MRSIYLPKLGRRRAESGRGAALRLACDPLKPPSYARDRNAPVAGRGQFEYDGVLTSNDERDFRTGGQSVHHPWYHQAPALLIQRHATPASPIDHPSATPLESLEVHSAKSTEAATMVRSHPNTRTPFHLLPVLSMT